MKRPGSNSYSCVGDVVLYNDDKQAKKSRPASSRVSLVKENSGDWIMIVDQNHFNRKYNLNSVTSMIVPSGFVNQCRTGSFTIRFADSNVISFRAKANPTNKDLPAIVQTLWELKQKIEYGSSVHDMFGSGNTSHNSSKPLTRSQSNGSPFANNVSEHKLNNGKRNSLPLNIRNHTEHKDGGLINMLSAVSPLDSPRPNQINGFVCTRSADKKLLPLKENVSHHQGNMSSNCMPGSPLFPSGKVNGTSVDSDSENVDVSSRGSGNKVLEQSLWRSTSVTDSPDTVVDSDEERSDRLNSTIKSPSEKAFSSTPVDAKGGRSLSCRLIGPTTPKLTAGRFYRKSNVADRLSYRECSSARNTPNLSFTKRQSLLTPDSPAKKSKIIPEVDNKENEGEEMRSLPYGFPNMGNTCYMNAVLQALYIAISNCQTCESAFMNFYNKTVSKENEGLLYKHFCRLLELIKSVNSGNVPDLIRKNLQNLKGCFQGENQAFAGNEMQDAHEYLTCLMSTMNDELGKKESGVDSESTAEPSPRTVIDCYFKYTVSEVIECTGCKNEVLSSQKLYDCGVNIPPREKNLQTGLQSAFNGEDNRECVCEKCDCKISTSTSKFVELPRILIIYVKRYNSNSVKIDTRIRAPKFISLDHYAAEAASLPVLIVEESKDRHEESCPIGDVGQQSDSLLNGANKTVNFDSKGDTGENDYTWSITEDDDDEDMKRAKEASLEEYNQSLLRDLEDDNGCEEDLQSCPEVTGNERHCYRLISYISHSGGSNFGHYTTYGYDYRRRKYFCFDDHVVTDVGEEKFYSCASNGYIFMYIHKDVCLESVPNSISRLIQPFNSLS